MVNLYNTAQLFTKKINLKYYKYKHWHFGHFHAFIIVLKLIYIWNELFKNDQNILIVLMTDGCFVMRDIMIVNVK